MNNKARHINKVAVAEYSVFQEFSLLVKLRLTSMVVFTSVIAFVLASGFTASVIDLVLLGLGGFLVAGAANVLNQVIEKDYDILMERTKNRPVAAGRMSMSNAVLIAGFMTLMGLTLLGLFNPLTAFFGTLSLVSYAFIYTPLKRQSSISVAIGAIPGALPMLIGCVAFDGYVSFLAVLLFSVQVLWQFTHFWAIAVLSFEDYAQAGYKIVPTVDGKPAKRIRWQAVIASLLLLPLSFYLFVFLQMHVVSLLGLIIIALGFIYYAVQFLKNKKDKNALHLMFASLLYLPLFLTILMIDQIF
jgi:protoheme IX farnesyltransferase